MEKLSDDLAQAVKKIKMLDSENKDLQDEKRGLNFQLESLRREISSALQERDKAIKECNDLRQKFGELGASSEGHLLTGDHTKKSRGRLIDSLGHITENGGRKEHLREDARSIGLFTASYLKLNFLIIIRIFSLSITVSSKMLQKYVLNVKSILMI